MWHACEALLLDFQSTNICLPRAHLVGFQAPMSSFITDSLTATLIVADSTMFLSFDA